MKQRKTRLIPILMLFLIVAGNLPCLAQSDWIEQQSETHITLELMRPQSEYLDDEGPFHMVIFLSGAYKFHDMLSLAIELPATSVDFSFSEWIFTHDEEKFLFGNPYIGLHIGGECNRLSGAIGYRIPTFSSKHYWSYGSGVVADFDRFEAFRVEMGFLTTRAYYRLPLGPEMYFRFGGGFSFPFTTESYINDDPYFKFSLQPRMNLSGVALFAGVSGYTWMRDGFIDDFDKYTITQLGVGARLRFNNDALSIGALLRLPFDGFFEGPGSVTIGINAGCSI